MTTLDRPIPTLSGAIERTLPRLRIYGTVLRSTPRFRILRAWIAAGPVRSLKHRGLSEMLRCQWQRTRLHTSWSRA
jgi:hypothetical protein